MCLVLYCPACCPIGTISLVSGIGEVLIALPNQFDGRTEASSSTGRLLLPFVRLLRTLRLFNDITSFRLVFQVSFKLIPSFWQLGSVLFMIICWFAQLGVLLFGGAVYHGNLALNNTVGYSSLAAAPTSQLEQLNGEVGASSSSSSSSSYGPLNFNDMASAVVTLFCLLVVNNWSVAQLPVFSSSSCCCCCCCCRFFVCAPPPLLNPDKHACGPQVRYRRRHRRRRSDNS
eukprot:COSAG05_NODE_1995_length_3729_cov_4.415427_4_plen_230_part_00